MNWEDWPPMSTQPIGVQPDGQVNLLYPLDLPGQLINLTETTPPTVSMGAGEAVSEDEVLSHDGYVVFVDTATGEASLIQSDGETTTAPADGTAYPLTVG